MTHREPLSRRAEPALHGGDFLPPCEIISLDNMLNLKQFLRDTYTFHMEDESFDYDLADIEGVLSELPGQIEEEDGIDDIPREMLAFGTPDGLEDGPISGRNRSNRVSSNIYFHKQEPQDYELEKDCPQVFDQDIFAEWASTGTPTQKEIVFKQLFVFVSCKVFEIMCETIERKGQRERWAILVGESKDCLANYPKKDEAKLRVLKHFPDATWPAGFLEYFGEFLRKEPAKKFLSDMKWVRDCDVEDQKILQAGRYIETTAKAAQSEINNAFNPRYQEPKSGSQNNIAELRLVRRYQWHKYCLEKAKDALRTPALKRLYGPATNPKEDVLEDQYRKKMARMTYDWYPNSWFTFIMMGKPAEKTSSLFTGGIATRVLDQGIAPSEAVARLGGLQGRKRFYAQVGRGEHPPTTPSVSSSGKSTKNKKSRSGSCSSVASSLSDEEKVKESRRLIDMQKELVDLAIAMGKPESTVRALQEELFHLISGFKERLYVRAGLLSPVVGVVDDDDYVEEKDN
jgi:hypothetical protein